MPLTVHCIEDTLRDPPTTHGQCEECSADRVALWLDEHEGGEFMYCRSCWGRRLARQRRRADAANARIRMWLER